MDFCQWALSTGKKKEEKTPNNFPASILRLWITHHFQERRRIDILSMCSVFGWTWGRYATVWRVLRHEHCINQSGELQGVKLQSSEPYLLLWQIHPFMRIQQKDNQQGRRFDVGVSSTSRYVNDFKGYPVNMRQWKQAPCWQWPSPVGCFVCLR